LEKIEQFYTLRKFISDLPIE